MRSLLLVGRIVGVMEVKLGEGMIDVEWVRVVTGEECETKVGDGSERVEKGVTGL